MIDACGLVGYCRRVARNAGADDIDMRWGSPYPPELEYILLELAPVPCANIAQGQMHRRQANTSQTRSLKSQLDQYAVCLPCCNGPKASHPGHPLFKMVTVCWCEIADCGQSLSTHVVRFKSPRPWLSVLPLRLAFGDDPLGKKIYSEIRWIGGRRRVCSSDLPESVEFRARFRARAMNTHDLDGVISNHSVMMFNPSDLSCPLALAA